MRSNVQVKAALVGASFIVVLAGCAMSPPKAERYVAPPAGFAYTNVRHDAGSFGSGTARIPGKVIYRTWQGAQVVAFESPESTMLLRPEGGFVAAVRGDTPLVSWEPVANWQWPLEVGKTWKQAYKMTDHVSKRVTSYEVTQTVEAYEEVTVPAGTFKAFRVRTIDTLGNDNTQWFSADQGIFVKQSLRRTAKHAAGSGARQVELESIRK